MDAARVAVDEYIEMKLKQGLDRAVKERFGDREVAELAVAASVASKVSEWAKVLGFAVGIPVALISFYLGLLGWKLHDGLSEANNRLTEMTKQADAYKGALQTMQAELQPREAEAAKVKEELFKLEAQIRNSSDQLQNLPELTHKVDDITAKLKDVGIGRGAAVFQEALKSGQARGIDVSHHNGQVDWARLKEAGISFAFFKASQGSAFRDKTFPAAWGEAKKHGILRGAYHVLQAGDVSAQVDNFLSTLQGDMGELPPSVDFEPSSFNQAVTLSDLLLFVQTLKARSGCTPVVATGKEIGLNAGPDGVPGQLGAYPLWLLSYGPVPQYPQPWKRWDFWQSSNGLSIDGMPATDFEIFNGTEAQLISFGAGACKKR